MKIVRLLQSLVISMMIIFVGVSLLGFTREEELTRAYMYLLSESAGCGLVSVIAAILILRAKRVESFALSLSKLLFISLGAFTLVWGLGTHFAGMHIHEEITVLSRLIRVAYGFFAGWFMIIIIIFVIQMMFPRKAVEEEFEDYDESPAEEVLQVEKVEQVEQVEESEDV